MKIFLSGQQQKTVPGTQQPPTLTLICIPTSVKREMTSRTPYFDPKMAISGPKIIKNCFENMFIWTAAKNCTRNSAATHFNLPTSFKREMTSKPYFDSKIAILGPKMAKSRFENIFIWTAVKNCTMNSAAIHFNHIFVYPLLPRGT